MSRQASGRSIIPSLARDLPEVEGVYTTAGDPDALVHLRVRDVADLTRVIDPLRGSGRVTGTKTLIALGTKRGKPRPEPVATTTPAGE